MTVPREGEIGRETWEGDSWKGRGAANAWGGFSVDPIRGLVFAGLGSAAFDFFGGDRHGDNLFANCTIALDAKTGKRLWHFQTLRHDLWDHDLPVYPNLVTVTREGKSIDAVAQVTKTGYVFLFNRETGKPLFDVSNQRVPASDVPGEQASLTQPVPVKPPPFSAQFMDESNVTDIGEANRASVLERFRKDLGAARRSTRRVGKGRSSSPAITEERTGPERRSTRRPGYSMSTRTTSRISSRSSNRRAETKRGMALTPRPDTRSFSITRAILQSSRRGAC